MSSQITSLPKIAYQGIPGSFSHLAASRYFQSGFFPLGQSRFKDIIKEVLVSDGVMGLIPVENSLAGSIYETYDLLSEYAIHVTGEFFLKVEHNLLALPLNNLSKEERITKINRVYSHLKAIEQCNNFFDNYPHIEKAIYSDTAGAAKFVAESKDTSIAAIASNDAAQLYGLEVLATNLEDDSQNFTRFLVIEKSPNELKGNNKCSVIFTLPHLPQSLLKALDVISDPKINITKIESRPIQGKPFEYVFYVDFEFPESEFSLALECTEKFRKKVAMLKILGYYKSGKLK